MIAFATAPTERGARVCPVGPAWNDFAKLIGIRGGSDPLAPLILGAWHGTSDAEKRARFIAQIKRASRSPRVLAQAGDFLRALPEDAWHFGPTATLMGDDDGRSGDF